MTTCSFKVKRFGVLAHRAENQTHCCITIFQSVVGFTKVQPRGIWFVTALTNMFVNLLFAYENMQ